MDNGTLQKKKVEDLYRWYNGITSYMHKELSKAIEDADNKEELVGIITDELGKMKDAIVSIPEIKECILSRALDLINSPLQKDVSSKLELAPLDDEDEEEKDIDDDEPDDDKDDDEALTQYLAAVQHEDFLIETIPHVLNIYKELKSILYTTADIYPFLLDSKDIDGDEES